jgi:hypothetical protein
LRKKKHCLLYPRSHLLRKISRMICRSEVTAAYITCLGMTLLWNLSQVKEWDRLRK